ncbi:protocatechuate 3,4-dioxygenase [Advenella sp. WQ 585]|uniref:Protocatechuate 3,4-dioxygenase n=1 Tax=Advenella mandrilli TaxID=2800330 RepID=A0ABS1EEV2_9BURK|nr:class III extradiol dioxygenase family protein [Advenella mandrilli]MBK1780145.1 protocatechuate 3,4-dioxygenase [Advenella mandrilli]
MGHLIGAIGSSHAPSISFAFDAKHQDRAEWKPFFDAYQPVHDWLKAQAVTTMIVIYNDHLNQFQFDAYPTFAMGISQYMNIADEGMGARDFAKIPGATTLGWDLAKSLLADEFDMTICQEMQLDHGVMSVLPLLMPSTWPIRIIPIHVNVLREPLPTPHRCWALGKSIGRFIKNTSSNERIVVTATGGLSHQIHGDNFGFVNPEWDNRFMDLITHEPEVLAQASHEDFIYRGGMESVEMMLWLTMRGALSETTRSLKEVQRFYWAPMLTGYGLLALEAEN